MNLRELILGVQDLEVESVEVPEWGMTVHIRQLSALDREELADEHATLKESGKNPNVNIRGRVLVRCLCGPDGVLAFDPKNPEDADAIGRRSEAALSRLFPVAMRLGDLDEDGDEDEVGNSDAGRSDDSATD